MSSGKLFASSSIFGMDAIGHVQGVGVGQLKDDQAHRRLAVQPAADVLVLGPQFDAADVADADDAPARRRRG